MKRHCGGIDVEHVWRNCRLARSLGVHLELTTLVVPGVNDREAVLRSIAERIAAELGVEVPWHLTRYHPAYRFSAPPTPVAVLERAWGLGRQAGLHFVYLGNLPGHERENTTCPGCGTSLIGRGGLRLTSYRLERGRCPDCGRTVPGVWGQRG